MKSVKVFMVLILMFMISGVVIAQEEEKKAPEYGWKNSLVGNLNFTQSQFDNWADGGEDNWNWQLDLNGKAAQKQEKFKWENSGKISYGRTKIADQDDRKSSDEISGESVLTLLMNSYVNPYVAVTGKTQLTPGYSFSTNDDDETIKTQISEFLAPGYFTESLGLGFEPVTDLKTRLGLAFKQTLGSENFPFADDDETLNEIETLRSEVGMESVTDFTRKLTETIVYTTKLSGFTAFDGTDRIDVDWDNIFSAKVAKYLSVSFNFRLFYDADITAPGHKNSKRQIKQVLAAGLTYSFL